jgi:hypothetical protein
MVNPIYYYAIIGRGRALTNPSGLARRRNIGGQRIDESLHRDMSWGETTVIVEWDRGEEISRELVEISQDEAEALIERFRENWGAG